MDHLWAWVLYFIVPYTGDSFVLQFWIEGISNQCAPRKVRSHRTHRVVGIFHWTKPTHSLSFQDCSFWDPWFKVIQIRGIWRASTQWVSTLLDLRILVLNKQGTIAKRNYIFINRNLITQIRKTKESTNFSKLLENIPNFINTIKIPSLRCEEHRFGLEL